MYMHILHVLYIAKIWQEIMNYNFHSRIAIQTFYTGTI